MMENVFQILWRDSVIGTFVDAMPDMWYLEGRWVSNLSVEADKFKLLTSKFDAKEVMRNPEKGTRVILKTTVAESGVNALVISLTENMLFVRQVLDDTAVQWLIENVD